MVEFKADKATSLRAIVFALTCFTFWAFADAIVKFAGDAKLSALQIIAMQSSFWLLFMVIKVGSAGKISSFKAVWPHNPRLQTVRSVLRLASSFFNAMALPHLPLTLFYALAFCSPFVISLMAAMILKEKLSKVQAIAIIVGFFGVLVAVNPFGGTGGASLVGIGWMMCSLVCFCSNIILVRVTSQGESTESLAFYNGLIGTLLFVPLALYFDGLVVPWAIIGLLAVMSLFTLLGDVYCYRAFRLAPAAMVEQYHYSQIVIGAILGYLLWGDIPGWNVVAGAAIIIGCGFYIAVLTLRQQRETKPDADAAETRKAA